MERWAIPLAWLVWAAIWTAMARDVKPVAARIDGASQRAHYLPLALAALLLLVPIRVYPLDARFVPLVAWPAHLGLGLVVAGIAYAVWARVRLAGNWSSDVTLKQGHELIVEGPYRWTRHPIYTGLLLAIAGTALAIGEWRGLAAVALTVVAWRRKIALEETLLRREFGETYASYARRVKALAPFLF